VVKPVKAFAILGVEMKPFNFLLTLGAGYLVGILWAPRKGSTLRKEILEHFLELTDEGAELARGAVKKGKEMKGIAEDGLSKASESIQAARQVAVETGGELKTIAEDSLNKATESAREAKDAVMEKGKEIRSIGQDGLHKASDSVQQAKDVVVEKSKEIRSIGQDGLHRASDSVQQAKEVALTTVSDINKNLRDAANDSKKVFDPKFQ
jgi:gas vesicle protein